MACKDYTRFKNVTDIKDSGLMNALEINMKAFLDWAFLGIGAWSDVNIPDTNGIGGTLDQLHWVDDPNFTKGQVWETPRIDWVYESGVDFEGSSNPIAISGVWINSSFYPPGHATYGHKFNYPLGRVIFNSPLPTTSTVKMNYSFRNVQVELAENSPIWKEIQYGSIRTDDIHLSSSKKGEWTAKPSIGRFQLPGIYIESVPRTTAQPTELGSGNLHINQDIILHVVAEDAWWRNRLVSLFPAQQEKTIILYDVDSVGADGVIALDNDGDVNPSGLMYPNLVEFIENGGYGYKKCLFKTVYSSELEGRNPHLYEGTVRITCKVEFGGDA